jgi:hypothetical protein
MKKLVFFAAAAATVALGGCSISNEDDGVKANSDARSVKIQLQGNVTDSRAVGPHIGNEAVVVSSGKLFFVNAGGTITKVVAIATGSAPESGGTVGIGALTAAGGTTIGNVPGTSTKVYVLANITATLPAITPGATNISVIDDFALQVAELYDATNKGVANVPVYGAPGAINATATPGLFEATLTIAPVGARFEIGKLTGGGQITGYKVEGVYINNYYSQQTLTGAIISAGDLKNNGSNPDLYAAADAAGSTYTAALSGAIFDYDAAGLGYHLGSGVCSPVDPADPSKVWGYNVLAPNSGDAPQIVVRLSNVTTSLAPDPYAGYTWFLTIKNMYTSAGGNTAITFAKRNVYRIVDLAFTEQDLATNPSLAKKDVTVEVTILDWISNDIGYDFN